MELTYQAFLRISVEFFLDQNPYIGCFPLKNFSDRKLESLERFLGNSPMMIKSSYLGCLRRQMGKVQSRRSWGLKQTIFLGHSRRSLGSKQTILAEADDPIFSIFYIPNQTILVRNSRTKPDDLGQNILGPNQTILGIRVRMELGLECILG